MNTFFKDVRIQEIRKGKTVKRTILKCPRCSKEVSSKNATRHFKCHGMLSDEIETLKAINYGHKMKSLRKLKKCPVCRKYVSLGFALVLLNDFIFGLINCILLLGGQLLPS